MKTYIQGTEDKITGFKMEWTFDAMSSAYIFDDADLSPEHKEASLQKVADEMLANMYNDHYFTYFYDVDKPIRYKLGKNAKISVLRAKAVFSFELPLVKPQPITPSSFKLLIFEPSYYVDMSWKQPTDIILSDALAKSCTTKIIEPDPTAEQINYAFSLPIDADPDNTLGQAFTQKVRLYCNTDKNTGESSVTK